MSMVQKEIKVVAILTADWHLSHKPPVWRSNEPDWYEAMARPLNEISELCADFDCDLILCAGDIFDKWNCPPELINFASSFLQIDNTKIWSIPGQHDLPNHNYDDIHQSAYCTLEHTNRIESLLPNAHTSIAGENFRVAAFPFGAKIKPTNKDALEIEIALVHDYVWMGDKLSTAYPNAPKDKRLPYMKKRRQNEKWHGYDVVVYGDNHRGFLTNLGKTTIFNCGTLMRRRSDEEDYKPQVGLLYSDGIVKPHYLDISKDKHLTAEEVKDAEDAEELDMELFAKELRKLSASALDFSEAMKRFWRSDKTRKAVRHIIQKAMEK